MELTRAELARYVDHTLLSPTASIEDVKALLLRLDYIQEQLRA